MSTNALEPLKLLVIGKTGVGKSAFCNFLFGKSVFESAAGCPVTEGIQQHQFKLNDTDVVIYDTEGIEVNKVDKIRNNIDEVFGYSHSKIENIHGVFYLINASSARIESFEIELIKQFIDDRNLPVFVVLTHSDIASNDQIQGIHSQLKSAQVVNIINLCTVQKKLRGGRKLVSDDELKEFHKALTVLFFKKSGRYYLYSNIFTMLDKFNDAIYKIRREAIRGIEQANLSIFNITEWEGKLEEISVGFENKLENFNPQFESALEQFSGIELALSPYLESSPYNDLEDIFESNFDVDFEVDNIDSIKKINSYIENIEGDDGFLSKIGAGLSLGYKVVTIESTLKEIVEDFTSYVIKKLDKTRFSIDDKFKNENWN